MAASSTATELVAVSGIDAKPTHLALADAYVVRRRRARWVGLACGLLLGFVPQVGTDELAQLVARVVAGYLLGVLLSELLTPRDERGAVRAASLQPRLVTALLPRPALVLPWLTLVPLLGSSSSP